VTKADQVAEAVRGVSVMDLQDLRAEWRRRWGPPPKLRSVQLLRHMIAWRIQAAAFGGLDHRTRTGLTSSGPSLPAVQLEVGVRLAREWKGVRHEVEVGAGEFLYQGASFNSLSEVARHITGVRWNGLRFFGLRS